MQKIDGKGIGASFVFGGVVGLVLGFIFLFS